MLSAVVVFLIYRFYFCPFSSILEEKIPMRCRPCRGTYLGENTDTHWSPSVSFHLTARRVQHRQRFKESPTDVDPTAHSCPDQPVGVTNAAKRNFSFWVPTLVAFEQQHWLFRSSDVTTLCCSIGTRGKKFTFHEEPFYFSVVLFE